MADVPGLIEGAAEGAGLGHEFLAHLERAHMLVHVVDASADDIEERYRTIRGELARYGAGLDTLPEVLVLNKIDLVQRTPDFAPEGIERVFALSCATGEGVEEFRRALFSLVPPAPEVAPTENELADYLVYRPKPRRPAYRILRTDRGYRVAGTPPSREELEEALRAAGVRTGTEVEVDGEVLEYQ